MSNASQVVDRNMAAFNAQDVEALLDNLSPEVEYVLPSGITFRGRERAKQYVQTFWSAFPDGKLSSIRRVANENEAATEAVFNGTHTGPLSTPNGAIPPTGKQITLKQVFLHRIEGGRIASETVYLDQLEFLTQLGLAGAPNT